MPETIDERIELGLSRRNFLKCLSGATVAGSLATYSLSEPQRVYAHSGHVANSYPALLKPKINRKCDPVNECEPTPLGSETNLGKDVGLNIKHEWDDLIRSPLYYTLTGQVSSSFFGAKHDKDNCYLVAGRPNNIISEGSGCYIRFDPNNDDGPSPGDDDLGLSANWITPDNLTLSIQRGANIGTPNWAMLPLDSPPISVACSITKLPGSDTNWELYEWRISRRPADELIGDHETIGMRVYFVEKVDEWTAYTVDAWPPVFEGPQRPRNWGDLTFLPISKQNVIPEYPLYMLPVILAAGLGVAAVSKRKITRRKFLGLPG